MVRKLRKLLPLLLGNFVAILVLQAGLMTTPAYSAASSQYEVQVQAKAPTQTTAATPPRNNGALSFYFQNIELKSLLQLIGKLSGLNFVISDAVKGNITLNLKDVTWQQALNIVMKTHGLTSRQIGNVMFINTLDEVSKMDMKEFQADQQVINLAPLTSTILRLKYMTAKDLADILKSTNNSLLTTRGQVVVDSRTNTAIVRDVAANISDIQKLVKKLDIPARQVLIEARIVNIDVTYEKQLGVRFGISNTKQLSGNLSGANQLAQGVNVANISPITDRLNFNNPASTFAGGAAPGSIGLALARLGNVLLDLELSALEEEGHSETIASPRVITSNQQKASIQTGQQIPYQQSTSSGATAIAFENAVLSLEITPQITPDNRIVLSLKATQDTAGSPTVTSQSTTSGSGGTSGTTSSTATSFGPPPINTEEVESNVILNNNETIVLGGVYKRTKSKTLDRIPFFGSLPLIGAFFRFSSERNTRSELLIFITPKIVDAKPIHTAKTTKRRVTATVITGGEKG
jgi:type IV pilus assembly protein PilQ